MTPSLDAFPEITLKELKCYITILTKLFFSNVLINSFSSLDYCCLRNCGCLDLDPSNMDSIVDFGKVEVANQPAQYQYPSNPAHVTSNQTGNLQQPQVYTRDDNIPNPPMMTLIATTPNNGFNCGATNGAVVMGDGGVCNRDVRFAQPQEILQDQNWSR